MNPNLRTLVAVYRHQLGPRTAEKLARHLGMDSCPSFPPLRRQQKKAPKYVVGYSEADRCRMVWNTKKMMQEAQTAYQEEE